MEEDFFENQYSKVNIDSQNYLTELAKKLYVKNTVDVSKNATMLIFRYYNDNNVLMEQENVPVIYDGNGIKEIIDYYLLTNTITTPSKITENWSLTPLTVTDKMRFCWKYSVTIKDNGARAETEPLICSTYGEKGERGAMYLGCFSSDSECEEKNGSAIFTGDFYLNSVSGYIRKVSKNEDSLIWKDVDSTVEPSLYNLAMNDAIASLSSDSETLPIIKSMNAWIKTLTAKTAFIENLFAQNITLNNNGLIKSNNFVSGSAGFKIQHNGNAEFNNGTFNNINANGGTFNNISATGGDFTSITVTGSIKASNGLGFINRWQNSGSLRNWLVYLSYDKNQSFFCCGNILYSIDSTYYMITPTNLYWSYGEPYLQGTVLEGYISANGKFASENSYQASIQVASMNIVSWNDNILIC